MGSINPFSSCCLRSSSKAKPTSSDTLQSTIPNPNPLDPTSPTHNPENLFNDPTFRYQEGDLIGIGPNGKVNECMDIDDGKFYACKYVLCQEESRKKVALYLDKKIFDLFHENLIYYIEIAENIHNPHEIMIISEPVSGGSLHKLLENMKVFDEKMCGLFTKQMLQGLNYLNTQGFAHGNLKPSNIMIGLNGIVKLSDFFTISKKFLNQNPENKAFVQNSLCYLAPEILLQGKKTMKSDIWALGCVILEMISGGKPWENLYNEKDLIINKLKNGDLPKIPENLSINAQNFLKRTLQINEDLRPLASDLLNDTFMGEFDEKMENLLDKNEEIQALKALKSMFSGQTVENNEIENAKNLLYSKIYTRTMMKIQNEERKNGRKRNGEESKECDKELEEMLQERDSV